MCVLRLFAQLFKYVRYSEHSDDAERKLELALLVVLSWTPYLLADMFELSGIIASISCAVMIAQYTRRNLSPQTQHAAAAVFRTLSFFAGEHLMFSYIVLCESYLNCKLQYTKNDLLFRNM